MKCLDEALELAEAVASPATAEGVIEHLKNNCEERATTVQT